MKIIVVTGISGAGKTTALNILEDAGYVTMDNLLSNMVIFLLQNLDRGEKTLKIDKLALGLDNRTIHTAEDFMLIYNCLKNLNMNFEILFLNSSNETILKRYNLTRRRHPVEGATLLESIKNEKKAMSIIKEKATFVIDTTDITAKELKKEILEIISNTENIDINIHLESFGYKYGIPMDKDLIFDVRVLPNPYYVEELRSKTGNDKEVYDYVMENKDSEELYKKIYDMIKFLLPLYKKDNKQHLSIGIGCSGGQHRSVAFVNRLAKDLKEIKGIKILKRHREGVKEHWT
ncbi:MAG: RNase adapter RapZ [Fusobacterium perfoetens]|uniref:RNase adapter RapZ n=1 Tax=Fusobacterium perfoetens TaxID=852 RepID=UPI0023F48889|nr:RNase adapter RapZ [Fusobacterium perfoetens]MCI6152699.1 RNase adapter RapZ [Fusobacterium perfoetens]MDY3236593.1 RNase adapter RapZ [Fusobacterium perfoetens]